MDMQDNNLRAPQEVDGILEDYLKKYRALRRGPERARIRKTITNSLVSYITIIQTVYVPKFLDAIKEVDPSFPITNSYFETPIEETKQCEETHAAAVSDVEEEEVSVVEVVPELDMYSLDLLEAFTDQPVEKKRKGYQHVFGFPGRADDEAQSCNVSEFVNTELTDAVMDLYQSANELSHVTNTLILPSTQQLAIDCGARASIREVSPCANSDTSVIIEDLEFVLRMIRTVTNSVQDVVRNVNHLNV